LRPLYAGFHLDGAVFRIEIQNACQFTRIHQINIGAKLLASGSVTAPGDADGFALPAPAPDDSPHIVQRMDCIDRSYPRRIELGVNIIDEDSLLARGRMNTPCGD